MAIDPSPRAARCDQPGRALGPGTVGGALSLERIARTWRSGLAAAVASFGLHALLLAAAATLVGPRIALAGAPRAPTEIAVDVAWVDPVAVGARDRARSAVDEVEPGRQQLAQGARAESPTEPGLAPPAPPAPAAARSDKPPAPREPSRAAVRAAPRQHAASASDQALPGRADRARTAALVPPPSQQPLAHFGAGSAATDGAPKPPDGSPPPSASSPPASGPSGAEPSTDGSPRPPSGSAWAGQGGGQRRGHRPDLVERFAHDLPSFAFAVAGWRSCGPGDRVEVTVVLELDARGAVARAEDGTSPTRQCTPDVTLAGAAQCARSRALADSVRRALAGLYGRFELPGAQPGPGRARLRVVAEASATAPAAPSADHPPTEPVEVGSTAVVDSRATGYFVRANGQRVEFEVGVLSVEPDRLPPAPAPRSTPAVSWR